MTGFVLLSIKKVGEEIKKKVEINLLKSHFSQVEELIKILQTRSHEYIRHIQTLQAMLYLDEVASAKEYIEGISGKYQHINHIVYTGNPALTALLNSKMKIAEDKNIGFDFAIKCDITNLQVKSWDLCSILGNLIDNAFEAVLQINDNRKVGVEIKHENKQHVIYVYNNGPKIPKKIKNKCLSLSTILFLIAGKLSFSYMAESTLKLFLMLVVMLALYSIYKYVPAVGVSTNSKWLFYEPAHG
ncbi:signal transduction histidine kinase regulating citrate/malate metabolism [Caldisalinibacter kiritimatiensis]|uniref:Signal transduction histidine kinase regulating citrate/malate metabolism n=2 Tax=Caldisalinibacter kiritimatiensis TaxID=1304284 RepID=R1AVL7_9FIRM|nr:signal transduction histidine kinase regulating citrate/malate metabolism [Caldisalinibacter kiritimatiensis]